MRLDHYFLFRLTLEPFDARGGVNALAEAGVKLVRSSSQFFVSEGEIFRRPVKSIDVISTQNFFDHGNDGVDFASDFTIGESPFEAGFLTYGSLRFFLISVEGKYAPAFIEGFAQSGTTVFAFCEKLFNFLASDRMIFGLDPITSELLETGMADLKEAFKSDSVVGLMIQQGTRKLPFDHLKRLEIGSCTIWYICDPI